MNIVEQARIFATEAHASIGQVRKYTGSPYIVHPIEVMEIVSTVPHDDAMLAAALLHDVVEDTPVTIEEIETEFGADVAELVGWLTDVSVPTDGNRKTRKALDREHSWRAPGRAQTVKLADLCSNCVDIVKHDKNFSRVYLREIELLITGLTAGDPGLRKRAMRAVEDGKKIVFGN